MRFGAHVSAAGGVDKALARGGALGCEVIQLFARSPQGGKAKEITDELVASFQSEMKAHSIEDVYIHAPYYINLASTNPRIKHGSVSVLRDELERGTKLGCRAMMFHPGSAKEVGEEKGAEMVIEGLNRIMDGYEGSCQLLIEISAGAGAVMGDTFEELATFIDGAERGKDIGVCFDTQHAFASGYDLRTKQDVDATFEAFDKIVGLDKMIASHCNDSKIEFEGHKDRHENLGKGFIGGDAFQFIVEHPKLQHIDLILETPMGKEKVDPRGAEVELLKKYRGNT